MSIVPEADTSITTEATTGELIGRLGTLIAEDLVDIGVRLASDGLGSEVAIGLEEVGVVGSQTLAAAEVIQDANDVLKVAKGHHSMFNRIVQRGVDEAAISGILMGRAADMITGPQTGNPEVLVDDQGRVLAHHRGVRWWAIPDAEKDVKQINVTRVDDHQHQHAQMPHYTPNEVKPETQTHAQHRTNDDQPLSYQWMHIGERLANIDRTDHGAGVPAYGSVSQVATPDHVEHSQRHLL
jgi:hypothetical protein